MTIGSALSPGFRQLRELVRRGDAMMSISGFAYRIGAVSNPRRKSAKAARGALRTAAVPLIAAAIVLGASEAIAQDREQVKVAFAHALPNVEGKRLVAVTVTYPPGAKSLAHHHAASAFIYAYVLSGAIRSQVGDEPAKIYTPAKAFTKCPVRITGSVRTRVTRSPPAYWRSSLWIPRTSP
jgi:mannose-6-phosphate isomerase-like protein (cupin superfamily)